MGECGYGRREKGEAVRRYPTGAVRGLTGLGLAAAAVAAAGCGTPARPALPAPAAPAAGPAAKGTYLALGDSVAFGFVPPDLVPAPNYARPNSLVSYPKDVGQALRLAVWNASCPGETTGSMLVAGAPSNGCENSPDGSPGYRALYPLHVPYQGTQMQYALKYLAAHRHTQLVTINIGGNDWFLCRQTTPDQCTGAGFRRMLATIAHNLTAIYAQIRDVARYGGLLVALTSYSIIYKNPPGPGEVAIGLIDKVIAQVTAKFGGKVADGFAAFEAGSAGFGGDACAAGLLIKRSATTCDIHPSPAGHLLLAEAIEGVAGVLPPK
jgi:lysophospholipase L1-like esterase